MASAMTARDNGAHQYRRRRKATSSSASPGSAALASSAMPQRGQLPGASAATSGHIGQYQPGCEAAAGVRSRAMPHFGQAPGRSDSTPGHMGQNQGLSPTGACLPALPWQQ
jgi:hypothetical protein